MIMEVGETGLVLCPVASFGVSRVYSSVSTRELGFWLSCHSEMSQQLQQLF